MPFMMFCNSKIWGNRPIVNDTEWNHYYIVLDVPDNSAIISFGVLLSGRGKVWIDELEFEEVSKDTPTTNIDYGCDLWMDRQIYLLKNECAAACLCKNIIKVFLIIAIIRLRNPPFSP